MAGPSLTYRSPQALVQTDWLAAHLQDQSLRIFDCTTHLLPWRNGQKTNRCQSKQINYPT